MIRTALICLSLLCVAATPVAAQDTQDGQLWMQALATGQLSKNWRSHLELQPRLFDNASELGITLVRTAVGRQLSPRATVWLGHAWIPRSLGPTTTHEQRIWQQLSLTFPRAGRWAPSARIRLEQRWLGQWANSVHRVRLMARAQRPLNTESPWHVALFNEAMITLDTTPSGPFRGYDRNRLWGGIGRRLSPTFTTEFGYMWENSTIRGPRQRNEHVALVVLNINWPKL